MNIVPPNIQLIHASDAPQHTGEVRTILLRMKEEKRISDFHAMEIHNGNAEHLSFKNEDRQGIIVLLTNEIERVRTDIEKVLKNITLEKQNIKLIEIIVDNLPYHNNFISFPQDLMPIRSRADMNSVWNDIEQDLQALFPPVVEPKAEVPVVAVDKKKYLKLLGISIFTVGLCITFVNWINLSELADTQPTAMIFSFFVPIIIFLIQKKNLEFTESQNGQKIAKGAVDWKKLLIKTGTTIVFFLQLLFIIVIILLSQAILPYATQSPSYIAVLLTLVVLFYRGKAATKMPQAKVDAPIKKYLKFFGALFLSFCASFVLWTLVVEEISHMYEDGNYYIFNEEGYLTGLIILTTTSLLLTLYRKKLAEPAYM